MSPDMTIEAALFDPMIRAVMRADRIEPQAVERLLRSKARMLDRARGSALAPVVAQPSRSVAWNYCCA